MSSAFVFESLKAHLKARGMTYLDVARALKVSEGTVKRVFATRNCTLERLDELCSVAQVELADLARGTPRESRLLTRLSIEQEEELVADPALLVVAVSALHQMSVEEIVELFDLSEAQCVKLLVRLERIGILELHEKNRIRLRIARTFSWTPDGPMMRYMKSQVRDFFNHAFSAPGELMRMVNVRLSTESQVTLLRQIEQIAREYNEQHNADAHLPLANRPAVSVLLAVRTSWEPEIFKPLARR